MERIDSDVIEIKAALRYMLLPIPTEKEAVCIEAIISSANVSGIRTPLLTEFLMLKYDVWKSDKHVDPVFKFIIIEGLKVSEHDTDKKIAESYFNLHSSLTSNPFISFEIAVIALSHIRLIVLLAIEEKMSATKIAKVIFAIDHRLAILSWKNITALLAILKISPQLNLASVQKIYSEDKMFEERYFADAAINDAAIQVGDVAHSLQYGADLSGQLMQLVKEGDAHLPYLQILHYQCLIAGFYDHVFSMPYEFSPRGIIATWLFSNWDKLLHTSNPFLNNAKAVDVLDINWARSRKPNEYEQAVVLVDILRGLDGMGFAAAQELSARIRRWLVRYIKLNEEDIQPIKSSLSEDDRKNILTSIAGTPTSTYGILEQRFVDTLASVKHLKKDGWRSRGLANPVNVNNLSQKKLGDCDFQESHKKIIVAYEAHGGTLSKLYFESHMRTLKRSLHERKQEMEGIADLSDWQLDLIFVAYGFEAGLPSTAQINGLNVNIQYKTFEELLQEVNPEGEVFAEQFELLFVGVLNNRRTPKFVREIINNKSN